MINAGTRSTGLDYSSRLSSDQVNDLLEITEQLVEERRQIREMLNQLPTSFGQVRGVLNELHRLVR